MRAGNVACRNMATRLLALLAPLAVLAYTPTPHGAVVTLRTGYTVEIAVEGVTTFRISALNGTTAPVQIATSMVAPKVAYATFVLTQVRAAGGCGRSAPPRVELAPWSELP